MPLGTAGSLWGGWIEEHSTTPTFTQLTATGSGSNVYMSLYNTASITTSTTSNSTSAAMWMSQVEASGYHALHARAERTQLEFNRYVQENLLSPEQWEVIDERERDRLRQNRLRREERLQQAERDRRAQHRAEERWRMGERVDDTVHPLRIAQRDAQARAVSETARLRDRAKLNAKTRARARAEKLLLSVLTLEQQATYKERGWFIVEGNDSKTKYRIRASESMVGNVDVLKPDGSVKHKLCAHLPIGTVPPGDQLVAQKVYLEADEKYFLKTANVHRVA